MAYFDVQVDPFQRLTAFDVFEHDVVQPDVAFDFRHRHGVRLIVDARLLVDELEDPLGRSHRDQQLIVHLAETVDRLPEAADVTRKGDQEADGQLVMLDQISAEPEQDQRTDPARNFDQRPETLVEGGSPVPRFFAVHVHFVKELDVFLLLRKRLGHADPLDRFVQVGVDPRVFHPHVLPSPADFDPQFGRYEKHDRHGQNDRQPQLPVDQKQNDDDAHQLHAVDHQVDDAVRKQLLQRVDVIRDAHEHRSRRTFIEKVERQLLDMLEQIAPQIIYDALSDNIRKFDAERARQPLNNIKHKDACRNRIKPGQARGAAVRRRDRLVDRHTRQIRNRQLRHRAENHHQNDQRQQLFGIRFHVGKQSRQLRPVKRFFDDFVVLVHETFPGFAGGVALRFARFLMRTLLCVKSRTHELTCSPASPFIRAMWSAYCIWYTSWYGPGTAINSSCLPRCTTLPSSKTRISSA